MRLDRFVSSHTVHGQKTVRQLLAQGRIRVDGAIAVSGTQAIDAFSLIELDEHILQARQAYYYMLHKPLGVVSATRDSKHRTVLDLFDEEHKEQLHIGGRLDFNTSGLMLLTNNGRWSRNITEPQHKYPKVYRVETAQPICAQHQQLFAAGVYLAYENVTTQPAELEILAERCARLTIYEGRYHQVKRMFGALNNKVLALHRESIGSITLYPNLAPGQYRPLHAEEITSVTNSSTR